MIDRPEELYEEFPELADKIHEMKASNAHFARLDEEYQKLNHEIYLSETNVEPTDDFNEVDMRKKRMALKDELYSMLTAD